MQTESDCKCCGCGERTLIHNAVVATLGEADQVIDRGAVAVQCGRILEVGPSEEMKARYAEGFKHVDAGGKLLLPGFICAHGHFYGMYSRGMALHDEPAQDFLQVLQRLWWRLDRALDPESVRLSALVNLVAAIHAGTTTIFDHHASPSCVKDSLDWIAEETKKAGVRCSLCYEVTDRNGPEEARAGIEENIRFIRRLHEHPDPMLHALFGLHAAFTLNESVLQMCEDEVAKLDFPVGYHVHVGEGKADGFICTEKFGARPVLRLHAHKMTGPHSLFAHCLDVTEGEMKILAATGTTMVHNPESNLNNAVGIADTDKLSEAGVTMCLGTDGMTMDMIQEHKFAYVVHKFRSGDPGHFSAEAAQLLWHNNAQMASRMFGHKVGCIEPGAVADIVLMDYKSPTPLAAGGLPWHLMFGMNSNQVCCVMCNGKWIMCNRKILTLDEDKIMAEACAHAHVVWDQIPRLVAEDKAKEAMGAKGE